MQLISESEDYLGRSAANLEAKLHLKCRVYVPLVLVCFLSHQREFLTELSMLSQVCNLEMLLVSP